MAIGRISGSVLKSNLTRNGVDLAFETSLLYLDVTNSRVGIGTSEPSTALHVVGSTTISATLTASSIVTNDISSADSTAIQINDGVNISGTLNAKTLITNTISSEDSSVIQINDGLTVTGPTTLQNQVIFYDPIAGFTRTLGSSTTLTANRTLNFPNANGTVIIEDVDTGNTIIGGWTINGTTVSSNDSSLITINDNVDVIGTLTTPTIQTNNISSADSSAIQINDGMNISGTLTANSTVTFNAGYVERINTLTAGTTITINCALAPVHKVTLTANTGFVITSLPTGGSVTVIIVQDGTGSRTATFGTDTSTAVKFAGGTPTLSTAASSIDIVTIFNDGTNYYGDIGKAYA